MARVRSPEKRSAILEAAVYEIARAGLGAPTAKIAMRAGVAEGTLFTYFATKEEMLNELYVALKMEVYTKLNDGFPHKARLKQRAWHVWSSFLNWAIEFPDKRKVSVQLNLSDLISVETRERTALERRTLDQTLREIGEGGVLSDLPRGFASATMSAMQEATVEFIGRKPKQRERLVEQAFEVYWRAVR